MKATIRQRATGELVLDIEPEGANDQTLIELFGQQYKQATHYTLTYDNSVGNRPTLEFRPFDPRR